MQLLILGMHRSGTSMITRLINMMGAYFGPEGSHIGYGKENPKGFWERKDVVGLNDKLLARQQCAWDRVAFWQALNPGLKDAPALGTAIKTLVLNLDAHRPWAIKDPRLCLALPYWKPHLEVPVAIIAYRSPLEIAQSLYKRNQIPHNVSIAMWEKYAVSLLNASLDMPRVFIQHQQIMQEPVLQVAQLHAKLRALDVLGLRMPSSREILAFVDPSLYRAKAEQLPESLGLSEEQRLLEQLLQGNYAQTAPCTVSSAAQSILENHALNGVA